jgi:hypothetical protein
MICNKCDFQNKADAKFCENCGSSLVVVCPKCQKTFPLGTNFCDVDGERLLHNGYAVGQPRANTSDNSGLQEPMPETYQWQSIVVFILCLIPLGLILTLPEIFWASKIKNLYLSGDTEAAKRLSKRSRNSLIWSIVCTVVFWIIVAANL